MTSSNNWEATDTIPWNSCYIYLCSCALNMFKTIEGAADCEIITTQHWRIQVVFDVTLWRRACGSRGLQGSAFFRKCGKHAPGDRGSHPSTTPLREPHISQTRICYPKCWRWTAQSCTRASVLSWLGRCNISVLPTEWILAPVIIRTIQYDIVDKCVMIYNRSGS